METREGQQLASSHRANPATELDCRSGRVMPAPRCILNIILLREDRLLLAFGSQSLLCYGGLLMGPLPTHPCTSWQKVVPATSVVPGTSWGSEIFNETSSFGLLPVCSHKDGDTASRGLQGSCALPERELGLLSVWSVEWRMFPNLGIGEPLGVALRDMVAAFIVGVSIPFSSSTLSRSPLVPQPTRSRSQTVTAPFQCELTLRQVFSF